MKRFILLLFLFFSIVTITQAQPRPHCFRTRRPHITKLPPNMTFDEFLKMNRQLDWKKIIEAVAVPGYIHFYAEHRPAGWTILAVRSLGFALSAWGLFDQMNHWNEPGGWLSKSGSTSARSQRNLYLFTSGLALNVFGFAFDWAHGDFIIERERNAVLYKYGIEKNWRPGLTFGQRDGFRYMGITLNVDF